MRRRAFPLCLVLAMLSFGLAIASPPRPAYACSCAMPPDPATALQEASAVFVGTVTNTDVRNGPIISSADPVRVTFDVAQVWKGPTETPLVVITARDSATCGFGFQRGVEYMVYAYTWQSANLETNICTRTAPTSSQSVLEDLRVLGEGKVPVAVAQQDAPPVVQPGSLPSPPEAQAFRMPATLIAALLVLSILATAVVIGAVTLVARRWRS